MCSRTLGSSSILINSVPALAQVGLQKGCSPSKLRSVPTVIPHPGLPKYRYSQCSRPCPGGVAKGMFAFKVTECSHCVPAPWAPKVSLFTVFPLLPRWGCKRDVRPQSYGVFPLCSRTLGSPSITIYSVPALAQVTQDR